MPKLHVSPTAQPAVDLHDDDVGHGTLGGGEVARYVGSYGTARLARAVFAGAVPPYLYKAADNPDGGLDDATIAQFEAGVRTDRMAFLDTFTTQFFSVNGRLMVSEAQRVYARDMAAFASPKGTLDCIGAFARTDFRADLTQFKLPTLVIHAGADAIVPLEVSGVRTHKAIPGSHLKVIYGAPPDGGAGGCRQRMPSTLCICTDSRHCGCAWQ